MSASETRILIEQAVRNFIDEVPALRQLRLVARLELPARGDMPIWRIELPGPKVTREPPGDARLELSIPRPRFNELAEAGTLVAWAKAYDRGDVRVSGDSAVVKLLANVIERQLARSR